MGIILVEEFEFDRYIVRILEVCSRVRLRNMVGGYLHKTVPKID